MRSDRTIGAVTALVVGTVTALAFAQSFHALRTFAEAQQVAGIDQAIEPLGPSPATPERGFVLPPDESLDVEASNVTAWPSRFVSPLGEVATATGA